MKNNIEINRRKFLEKFAKFSTATVMIGVCVACPGPGPGVKAEVEKYYTVDIFDIDGKMVKKSLDISINLSVIYLNLLYDSSLSFSDNNLIIIKNENTKSNISFTQNKIDDKTLKLTLVDNQLNYGSYYSLSIDNIDKLFKFNTTSIKLSKERLSLSLDAEDSVVVEGLYIKNETISDFTIVSVENNYNNYEKNGRVISIIENKIIRLRGFKQGKVMLKVIILQNNSDIKYSGYIYVEIT